MHRKLVQFLSVSALFSALLLTSCKKNCTCTPPPEVCKETASWKGEYATTTSRVDEADSLFINNGIAHMTHSPFGYYFSGIKADFPACRKISGDSVRMDVRVKNPLAEGAIEQLDVSLVIWGEQDSVFLNFVGRSIMQQQTFLGLYNGPTANNMPELVQLFENWTEVSLEVKNGLISAYKSGTLLKSYTIPGGKTIGRIKRINVGFKGTGSVDWIRLYNQAGTLKFREEFNVAKKSSIEWF